MAETQTYRIEIRFDVHGTLETAEARAQEVASLLGPSAEVTSIFDENWEEVSSASEPLIEVEEVIDPETTTESPDPETLGAQLLQSLVPDSPQAKAKIYKSYLAQIVQNCVREMGTSNTGVLRTWLNAMEPAIHQLEKIQNAEPSDVESDVARDVWMVQWFLEVAIEALSIKPAQEPM